MSVHCFEGTLVGNVLRSQSLNLSDYIELFDFDFFKAHLMLVSSYGYVQWHNFALICFHAVLLKIESIESFGRSTFKALFKV